MNIDMDNFNYLQEDTLSKWVDAFQSDSDPLTLHHIIEQEFLPRFEAAIYENLASKMLTTANRATDILRELKIMEPAE